MRSAHTGSDRRADGARTTCRKEIIALFIFAEIRIHLEIKDSRLTAIRMFYFFQSSETVHVNNQTLYHLFYVQHA